MSEGGQGYADKEATGKKARDLERDASREKEGLPVSDRSKATTPIGDAPGVYLADLERLGRDDMYAYDQRVMVTRVAEEAGWGTVGSIRAEGMTRWLGSARKAKKPRKDGTDAGGGELLATTKNRYLESVTAFANFLARMGYLEGNPLAGVSKGKASKKERKRRALSDEEVGRLLGLPVPEGRLLVDRAALLTGLRREELELLEWGDLDLEGDPPTITLRETCNRAGRKDVIGLHPSLAKALSSRRGRPAPPIRSSRSCRSTRPPRGASSGPGSPGRTRAGGRPTSTRCVTPTGRCSRGPGSHRATRCD